MSTVGLSRTARGGIKRALQHIRPVLDALNSVLVNQRDTAVLTCNLNVARFKVHVQTSSWLLRRTEVDSHRIDLTDMV